MDKIIEFVKKELNNDNSGHDFNHTKRVVNNAYKILKEEKANEKIVITSCYLHDIVDDKLFSDTSFQIEKVRGLLNSLNYTIDEIKEIIYIITNISYRKSTTLDSINAMIVRDADRLDAIGAIGIIRTIEYGNSHNRKFYDDNNLKYENNRYSFNESSDTTLSHFYDKLLKLYDLMHTDAGKKLAKKRAEFLKIFLDEFYEEL